MLDMPASMTRTVLYEHLKTVTVIRGTLYFKDNLYLSAMTFLSNVVSLNGAVYGNNPQLVDARLFALQRLNGNVTVEGCDRLCPARYTAVGANVDDQGCANPELRYFVHIDGPVARRDAGVIGSILQSALHNVTGGVVSLVYNGLSGDGMFIGAFLVERHGDGDGA